MSAKNDNPAPADDASTITKSSDTEERPDSKLQIDMAEAQLRKLHLEVMSLQWHNSRIGRLSQFATIFTISATVVTMLATSFGIWQGYSKYITDKQKDRDLRTKELAEQTNNQYRTNLQQLLQYPSDDKQTSTSVIFLMRNLQQVTENGYQGTDLQEREDEIGTLLIELIRSSQFDLSKDRNVEFDLAAMGYMKYYSNSLTKDFGVNTEIMDQYSQVIDLFRRKEKRFESIEVVSEVDFRYAGQKREDISKLRQYMKLIMAYRGHVKLLNKGIESYPENAENAKKDLVHALCAFYESANSWNLTKYTFKVDDLKLKEMLARCDL